MESLPEILQLLKQEELISQDVVEKLLEKPYTFPQMIRVLKETKKSAAVTQYLLSSPEEMLGKLSLLTGELST